MFRISENRFQTITIFFWPVRPCSPVNVKRGFGRTYFIFFFDGYGKQKLIKSFACLVYSSTLLMKKISSSEKSVDFYRTTRQYFIQSSLREPQNHQILNSYLRFGNDENAVLTYQAAHDPHDCYHVSEFQTFQILS